MIQTSYCRLFSDVLEVTGDKSGGSDWGCFATLASSSLNILRDCLEIPNEKIQRKINSYWDTSQGRRYGLFTIFKNGQFFF